MDSTFSRFIQALLITAIIALFCYFVFYSQLKEWSSVWQYRDLFVRGWFLTVILSVIALCLSLMIGMIAALMRLSSVTFLRYLSIVYIEFIRGTPLLVQLLIFYYVIADSIGLENRYVSGVITLSLFSGAYIAEILRAGIQSISKTQLESAKAIGFTKWQTFRFVTIPQALRQSLPPLAGQFASIIKDSSLLSIIGINELTNNAQQISSVTYSTLESFFPLAIGYLILTLPISLFSKHLEARYRYET